LLVVRFLLGLAEGGVWPATLVLLARWFPPEERGRANSYWIACNPVAGIVVPPISGWILTWGSWHTLFILEGLPPLIWAVIWWLLIDDSPDTARWISPAERDYINDRYAETVNSVTQTEQRSWTSVFKNGLVWWLVAAYFLLSVGSYGVSLWLPVIMKDLTKQGFGLVGLLVALPYVAGLIGIYINSNHSDRTGERKLHASTAALGAGIALLISALFGPGSGFIGVLFLIISQGFLNSYSGIFWTLPPLFLQKASLGTSMGLINALGGLGGFLGPFLIGYLFTLTGSNITGLSLLAVALVGTGLLTFFFPYGGATQVKASFPKEVSAEKIM
jgi:sugar phosphate permease